MFGLYIIQMREGFELPLASNVAMTGSCKTRFLATKGIRGTERRAIHSKLGTSCVVGVIIGAKGEGALLNYKAEVPGVSQSGKGKKGLQRTGQRGILVFVYTISKLTLLCDGLCWISD